MVDETFGVMAQLAIVDGGKGEEAGNMDSWHAYPSANSKLQYRLPAELVLLVS